MVETFSKYSLDEEWNDFYSCDDGHAFRSLPLQAVISYIGLLISNLSKPDTIFMRKFCIRVLFVNGEIIFGILTLYLIHVSFSILVAMATSILKVDFKGLSFPSLLIVCFVGNIQKINTNQCWRSNTAKCGVNIFSLP